jgi:DNA-binding transcriptional regulator GbsR (MarR family)
MDMKKFKQDKEKTNKEKVTIIKNRIIEQIAYNMRLYGVSQTVGRVMATIYYHDKPMTLDELSKEMGMTKMSMSNAARELVEMGVAEKIHVKGSRKDHYVIEEDYYQFFIDLFCTNWRKTIHTKEAMRIKLNHELEEIIHDKNEKNEVREDAKKLMEENFRAIEYFDWVSRLINHFETHEILKYVPIKKEDNMLRDN